MVYGVPDGDAVLIEITMAPLSWLRVIGVLLPKIEFRAWIKNDKITKKNPFDMRPLYMVVI
jgi:hypothetical protein